MKRRKKINYIILFYNYRYNLYLGVFYHPYYYEISFIYLNNIYDYLMYLSI